MKRSPMFTIESAHSIPGLMVWLRIHNYGAKIHMEGKIATHAGISNWKRLKNNEIDYIVKNSNNNTQDAAKVYLEMIK